MYMAVFIILLCPDPAHYALEQGCRILPSGNDCPVYSSGHICGWLLIPGFFIYGFLKHTPDTHITHFICCRPYNIHPVIMFFQMSEDVSETVLVEKTHCNPGRIRSKSQDIKTLVQGQTSFHFLHDNRLTHFQTIKHTRYNRLIVNCRFNRSAEYILIYFFTILSPVYNCCITNLACMGLIRKEMIKGCGICIGRIGPHRRIVALFFPERLKRRCVKRYKCRTAGLCPRHSFDQPMDSGYFCLLSGYKADSFIVRFSAVSVDFPGFSHIIIILHPVTIYTEDQICPGYHLFQVICKRGMLCGAAGIPGFKKIPDCGGSVSFYPIQYIQMFFLCRSETFF